MELSDTALSGGTGLTVSVPDTIEVTGDGDTRQAEIKLSDNVLTETGSALTGAAFLTEYEKGVVYAGTTDFTVAYAADAG